MTVFVIQNVTVDDDDSYDNYGDSDDDGCDDDDKACDDDCNYDNDDYCDDDKNHADDDNDDNGDACDDDDMYGNNHFLVTFYGRHAWIIPTSHVTIVNKLQQLPF